MKTSNLVKVNVSAPVAVSAQTKIAAMAMAAER